MAWNLLHYGRDIDGWNKREPIAVCLQAAKFTPQREGLTMYSEIIQADGHLVDSQILSKIFDRVIACGSEFEVVQFSLGKTN